MGETGKAMIMSSALPGQSLTKSGIPSTPTSMSNIAIPQNKTSALNQRRSKRNFKTGHPPNSLSQGVSAIVSTRGRNAMSQCVSIRMSVSNAKAPILFFSVHGKAKLTIPPPTSIGFKTIPIPPNKAPTSPPQMPTPVKAKVLNNYLKGYNPILRQEIITGFQNGFTLGFAGDQMDCLSDNLKTAKQHPDIVRSKIAIELDEGRFMGPFDEPPFTNFRSNPMGLVEKKGGSGFRLIHHLSFPHGSSVNDSIPRDQCSVQYSSIQDAINSITKFDDPVFLAKSDIAHAFRNIPVHPVDYHLLGLQWEGKYFYDRCLPMGASSSCAIFEKISTGLEWVLRKNCPGVEIHHVLDDFIFISPQRDLCQQALATFRLICQNIALPVAEEKTLGPSQVLPFLGITLDTIKHEARLPSDKIAKCTSAIKELLASKRVRLKQLLSLLGLLNFALSVVLPGRPFLRRMYNLTMKVKQLHHYVTISKEAKDDLKLWLSFIENFNGKSFFHTPVLLSSSKLKLYTDASGSIGYGAIFGSSWLQGTWPPAWRQFNIAVLEFYPIVAALKVWGQALCDKRVLFITDNQAIVAVINNQTTKDKKLLFLLRILVLQCLRLNIEFSALYIPSQQNAAADALSRAKNTEFFQVCPDANPLPSQVPRPFLPENLCIK